MKITDIKRQQKRADRVSVFVEGKYAFSLLITQAQELGIKVGQELSSSQVTEFKQKSNEGKLMDLVLRWLTIRPRSQWEVEDYLRRKSDDMKLNEQTLARVIKMGYVDDNKFAESWIRSRRALKSTSKTKLRQELFQKRVAKDVVEQALAEDEVEDAQALKQLIGIKSKQSRYHDKQKLMAYLARQGFRYDDIKAVLDGDK